MEGVSLSHSYVLMGTVIKTCDDDHKQMEHTVKQYIFFYHESE
jgi:hypothetical protein